MDSGMNSIESMYLSYDGLLEEFSEDVIRSRYAFLYKECMEFLKSQNLESEVRLDEVLLMHAVLDYFRCCLTQGRHVCSLQLQNLTAKLCLQKIAVFIHALILDRAMPDPGRISQQVLADSALSCKRKHSIRTFICDLGDSPE